MLRDFQAKQVEAIRDRFQAGEPVPPMVAPPGGGRGRAQCPYCRGLGYGPVPEGQGYPTDIICMDCQGTGIKR